MNRWFALVLLLMPALAEAQAQQILHVPADSSFVRLERPAEFMEGNTKIRVEKGSYLVSAKTMERYQLYEATLAMARMQLLASRAKVDTLLSTLFSMEEKLKAMETVNSTELGEDLSNLQSLQADLQKAQMELKAGNDELAIIKGELEKVQKLIERRSRLEKIIRVTIGAGGVVAGLLLGLAI